MKKLWLASPTYGHVDPKCVTAIRLAALSAAKYGTEWLGDIAPDRMGYSLARNTVIDFVRQRPEEEQGDGIFWIDSDMLPRSNSIAKIMADVDEYGFDFVSGTYHQRHGQLRPCFHMWDPDVAGGKGGFRINILYEPDQIYPAAGCGFGFVYTSMKLIRAIAALPKFDHDRGAWFPDKRYGDVSEDLGFCLLARDAGFQLYVDTGVQVGHLGEVEIITRESYLRSLRVEGVLPTEVQAVGS